MTVKQDSQAGDGTAANERPDSPDVGPRIVKNDTIVERDGSAWSLDLASIRWASDIADAPR